MSDLTPEDCIKGLVLVDALKTSVEEMEIGKRPLEFLEDTCIAYRLLYDKFKDTTVWPPKLHNDLGKRLVALLNERKRQEEYYANYL